MGGVFNEACCVLATRFSDAGLVLIESRDFPRSTKLIFINTGNFCPPGTMEFGGVQRADRERRRRVGRFFPTAGLRRAAPSHPGPGFASQKSGSADHVALAAARDGRARVAAE